MPQELEFPVRRIPTKPSHRVGSNRSVARLQSLGYDPIGELVKVHQELEKAIKRQEDIRDGRIVELLSSGKPRSYRPEVHYGLYDKLIVISEKLLRYGYARVSETTVLEEKSTQALIVNLTPDGEVFTINGSSTDDEETEDDGDDWRV